MKQEIPFNNVPFNYTDVLDSFVEKLAERQVKNIQAILLTGSYARGDANLSSDLDIWILFKDINHDALACVGEVTRSSPVKYDNLEVNAQCLSLSEFECGHFSNFISRPIIYCESVLLYGSYVITKPSICEVENIYKKILAETLLSVRHYICVNEPKENLSYRKITAFILKPLLFALRLERFAHNGKYPLSTNELMQACESKYTILVRWFISPELLQQHILENHVQVLALISDLIQSLLGSTSFRE